MRTDWRCICSCCCDYDWRTDAARLDCTCKRYADEALRDYDYFEYLAPALRLYGEPEALSKLERAVEEARSVIRQRLDNVSDNLIIEE